MCVCVWEGGVEGVGGIDGKGGACQQIPTDLDSHHTHTQQGRGGRGLIVIWHTQKKPPQTHTTAHADSHGHADKHTNPLWDRMEGWIDEREKRWRRDGYSSDRQRDGWTEGWRE